MEGCSSIFLPWISSYNVKSSFYQSCNSIVYGLNELHNSYLGSSVANLNSESLAITRTLVNLDSAFTTILNKKRLSTGNFVHVP